MQTSDAYRRDEALCQLPRMLLYRPHPGTGLQLSLGAPTFVWFLARASHHRLLAPSVLHFRPWYGAMVNKVPREDEAVVAPVKFPQPSVPIQAPSDTRPGDVYHSHPPAFSRSRRLSPQSGNVVGMCVPITPKLVRRMEWYLA